MHVIVWEFHVADGKREAFERAYGTHGPWAVLFGKAIGYKGTELLRDEGDPSRFITIDRWETPQDFDNFKKAFGPAYEALDRELEGLSAREVKIGVFIDQQVVPLGVA